MAGEVWDEARVQRYVIDRVEESLTLDYKAAAKLARSNERTNEITRIVSAMANSAGGIVIFGVAEDQVNKHLPERIDPVNRRECSKETLEHLINNIRPKLDVVIHPVPIGNSPDLAVYVVEIPQSHTAHQATDKKYYKRYNFESVPMDDYEIRDVEGRRQQPRLDVQLQVVRETTRANSLIGVTGIPEDWPGHPELKITLRLEVRILNAGSTMVRYLEVKLDLPKPLSSEWSTRRTNEGEMPETSDFSTYETRSFENVVPTYRSYGFGTNEPYQPPYHYPVLPGMTYVLGGISVTDNALVTDWGESAIRWMAAGDIVPMRQGEVLIKDLLSGAIDASELTS